MGSTLNLPTILGSTQPQMQPLGQLASQGDDGLPPGLIDAIIKQESGGNPKARGKKGELGLMQIMPKTAAQFGVQPSQLTDPIIGRRVGTQYIQSLIKKYKGDVPTALAAFNAGEGNVARGRVPKS